MTLEQNVREVNSAFVAIKDKIVECGVEVAEGTHARDYANKVGEVFNEGKKSQYDEFWDNYQDYGNRTHYYNAFSLYGWTENTYKPKYDIKPTSATNMYWGAPLKKISYGNVKIDFSKCPTLNQMFQGANQIGVANVDVDVDCSSATEISQTFSYNPMLVSIKKLIVHEALTYKNVFSGSGYIEELQVEGIIGQDGFSIASTKLNRASIVSIINALSSTASGKAVGLSKTAINTAFETASGKKDGSTSAEWLALVATKPNWTISLAP